MNCVMKKLRHIEKDFEILFALKLVGKFQFI